MTKIIELRPDRSLLNPRFEKYQFSPDVVPVKSEISLENGTYITYTSINNLINFKITRIKYIFRCI